MLGAPPTRRQPAWVLLRLGFAVAMVPLVATDRRTAQETGRMRLHSLAALAAGLLERLVQEAMAVPANELITRIRAPRRRGGPPAHSAVLKRGSDVYLASERPGGFAIPIRSAGATSHEKVRVTSHRPSRNESGDTPKRNSVGFVARPAGARGAFRTLDGGLASSLLPQELDGSRASPGHSSRRATGPIIQEVLHESQS